MKPTKPLAPLAPLAPTQPVMPSQPLAPTGGSFGTPPVSTYDQVYRRYESTKEKNTEAIHVNQEGVANDLFDPIWNKEVREKYKDSLAPTVQAMAELVRNQYKAYDEGVINGLLTNLGLVGETLDKVTGLPVRALVNQVQTGESFWKTWGEGFTTNHSVSGADLRRQAGVEFDSPVANFAADLVTEVVLDPTTWIGIGAATKAGKASAAMQSVKSFSRQIEQALGSSMIMAPIGHLPKGVQLGKQGLDAVRQPTLTAATLPPSVEEEVRQLLKAENRQAPTTQHASEVPLEQVEDASEKVKRIIEAKPYHPEHIEMDKLAKQQVALDEIFISATTRAAEDVFGQAMFRNYDAKEFFDLINQKLVNKDTTELDLIDDVVAKLKTYQADKRSAAFPIVKKHVEQIQATLEQARTQLNDYRVLHKLLEEEGELDLLYTTEFFMEKLKERGLGGRWDEDMIYTWQKSVEPALTELRRNPHLMERHPELKELRNFYLWMENPAKRLDEQAFGEAFDRVQTLLERQQLHPMDTKGFNFIFHRLQSATVPVTEAERLKAGLTEPEHFGHELKSWTVKADQEIEAKLRPLVESDQRELFRYELTKQLEQFKQMDKSRIAQYSEDTQFYLGIEEDLEDFIHQLSRPRRTIDLLDIYEEFGDWRQRLIDQLESSSRSQMEDLYYNDQRKRLETTLGQLRTQFLEQVVKERHQLKKPNAMTGSDAIAMQMKAIQDQLEQVKQQQRLASSQGIEEVLSFTEAFETKMQQALVQSREVLVDYEQNYAHLQLNKQRTQSELIHNVRASEALNQFFTTYEDKKHPFQHILGVLRKDLPSVPALENSIQSIQRFEQFMKQFEAELLKAGHDYQVDNRTLDALYNYLEKKKQVPRVNHRQQEQIRKLEMKLKVLQEHYAVKPTDHLKILVSDTETRLKRLKHDIIKTSDVKLPDILKPYRTIIEEYLQEVKLKGLDLARVPDGPFSSQLKHVSDDLKNHFPMMEVTLDKGPDWTLVDLLKEDATLTVADIEKLYDLHLSSVALDGQKFHALQRELSQLMEDAKSATREVLRLYKEENRQLSRMYLSNEDAYQFARQFQMGYKNIAEYLAAENPRVMVKNGATLDQVVSLRATAKSLFPEQPAKAKAWTARMQGLVEEAGADQGLALEIFHKMLRDPEVSVPQAQRIQQEVYQWLFPHLSYTGDEWDKLMKDAIVRSELVRQPELYAKLIEEKLMPTRIVEDLQPENFVDHLRGIYNHFRDRDYVEAMQYISIQATKDAWDLINTSTKNQAHIARTYQQLAEVTKPLSREDLLRGIVNNPLFQLKSHTKTNTWEKAKTIFKENPHLRAVAVVEADTPFGYKVVDLNVKTKHSYDQAVRLNAMILDYESAEHLRSLFKVNPFKDQPLLRFWQKWFVQTYKVQALINVGFHFSNFFDIILKNVSQSSVGKLPSTVWEVFQGQYDVLRYQDMVKRMDLLNQPLHTFSSNDQALYKEIQAFKRSLASGGELTSEALREGRTPIEHARQWLLYDNPVSRGNQAIGNFIEEGGRLALFRQMKRQGDGTASALYTVMETHFDYSNKSDALQWAELIFPFTTFAIRNAFFWSSQMMTNPKLVETLYEAMQYNYAEHGYDLEERDEVPGFIGYNLQKGNWVMGDKILKNGNSLLDAMTFVIDPVENMTNRLHPIIKATAGDWTGEAANWDQTIPFQRQVAEWGKTFHADNDLGLWNMVAYEFYDPRVPRRWDNDVKGKYPDYPDYPRGQKYYPRYHGNRSYARYRQTHSYNFYKSLYTSTGKSRLAMRLTPTNYRNLEGRIKAIQYDMKY